MPPPHAKESCLYDVVNLHNIPRCARPYHQAHTNRTQHELQRYSTAHHHSKYWCRRFHGVLRYVSHTTAVTCRGNGFSTCACKTSARVSRLVARLGWSGPSALSWISIARSRRGSASSSLPWQTRVVRAKRFKEANHSTPPSRRFEKTTLRLRPKHGNHKEGINIVVEVCLLSNGCESQPVQRDH